MGKLKTTMKKAAKKTASNGGLDSFRNQFDKRVIVPNKVRAAFAAMAKDSPEAWLEEADFADKAGVTKEELRPHREEFDTHIVEVKLKGRSAPKRIWFADSKVAAKARG